MTDEPPASPGGDGRPPTADRAPRRLDRVPGERYRGSGGAPGMPAAGTVPDEARGGVGRAAVAGLAVAALGAAGFALLGSYDLGLGLIALSGFVGWAVAIALVWGAGPAWRGGRSAAAIAAALAAGSVVAGLAVLWAWSRVEGGVLGPLDYLDQRFGLLLAGGYVAVAAALAALRGR